MRFSHVVAAAMLTIVSTSAFGWRIFSAEGNGIAGQMEKQVESFSIIRFDGNFQIEIRASDSPYLKISGDENLFEYIEVEQSGALVEIVATRRLKPKLPLAITVGIKGFQKLSVADSGTIIIDGTNQDLNEVVVSGASHARLVNISASDLKLVASGASTLEATGSAESMDIAISGASHLNVQDFSVSSTLLFQISGASSLNLGEKSDSSGAISGASTLYHKGSLDRTKIRIARGSKIIKL